MTVKRMSHAVYDTSYHLLWAPKYGKWILKQEVRDAAKEMFQEILAARDCGVLEMEIATDHVHIFASIPPRYSIGEVVRVLKSVSAKEIFRNTRRSKVSCGMGNFGKMDTLFAQSETR